MPFFHDLADIAGISLANLNEQTTKCERSKLIYSYLHKKNKAEARRGRVSLAQPVQKFFFMRQEPTSPVLQAEKIVEAVADKRRDLLQVVSSNPGGEE